MNYSPSLCARTLVLASLSAAVACAQTVAPASSTASSTAKESSTPVQLSPFEVSTEKDNGFAAASSLAGGRLAGDLRDTPVAYSVITRDFIDALGITDLQTAAEWATSSTLNVDNGMQNFFSAPINYTIRGAGAGRPQRNFFPQFNNGDSYNLERSDFGRPRGEQLREDAADHRPRKSGRPPGRPGTPRPTPAPAGSSCPSPCRTRPAPSRWTTTAASCATGACGRVRT